MNTQMRKRKKNWILLGYGEEEEVEVGNIEKRELSIGEV